MNTGCKLMLCLGVSLGSVSCTVTYGNKDIIDPKALAALKTGNVSVHDVYRRLGQPSDVDRNSLNESHWVYRYRAAANDPLGYLPMGGGLLLGGKNGDVYSRDFYFDSSDKVIRAEQNRKALYTSNLFSLGRTVGGWFDSQSDSSHRVKKEMKRIGKNFDESKSAEDQLLEKAL